MALAETGDLKESKVDGSVDVDVVAAPARADSGPPAVAVLGLMGDEVNVGIAPVSDMSIPVTERSDSH